MDEPRSAGRAAGPRSRAAESEIDEAGDDRAAFKRDDLRIFQVDCDTPSLPVVMASMNSALDCITPLPSMKTALSAITM